jgi:hypothetical protein
MKIFGIGLNRTGTTSLAAALTELGYHTIHAPKGMLTYTHDKLGIKYNEVERYDAVVGTPMPLFYRQLDHEFPGSKFILTTRDVGRWAESTMYHHTVGRAIARRVMYGPKMAAYMHEIYGRSTFEFDPFVEAYNRHNSEVIQHFTEGEPRLLVMDICGRASWDPLCAFLQQPVPEKSFPLKNRRGSLRGFVPSPLVRIVEKLSRT